MNVSSLIANKQDGRALSEAQINTLVEQIVDHRLNDKQLSDFTLAVYRQGMDLDETTFLTRAMSQAGERFRWSVDAPVVDKHSTGGVGDLVSLILAPILAACGCFVPMISGRSLGHTGGTINKLESIPGYCVQPDTNKFKACVETVGTAIIAQSKNLAPADERLYAMRNQNNTINSVALIVSSILSKKMAEGLDALIVDIKYGNGAWFDSEDDAQPLKNAMQTVAKNVGLNCHCCLTSMASPISYAVGNSLEVYEAITFLTNQTQHSDLLKLVVKLATKALIMSGLQKSQQAASEQVKNAVESGAAAERFAQMVSVLGGPANIIETPQQYLPVAPVVKPVLAEQSGQITAYDMKALGTMCHRLERSNNTTNKKDLRTGVSQLLPVNSIIEQGQRIATVHAATQSDWQLAQHLLLSKCIRIDEHTKQCEPMSSAAPNKRAL